MYAYVDTYIEKRNRIWLCKYQTIIYIGVFILAAFDVSYKELDALPKTCSALVTFPDRKATTGQRTAEKNKSIFGSSCD